MGISGMKCCEKNEGDIHIQEYFENEKRPRKKQLNNNNSEDVIENFNEDDNEMLNVIRPSSQPKVIKYKEINIMEQIKTDKSKNYYYLSSANTDLNHPIDKIIYIQKIYKGYNYRNKYKNEIKIILLLYQDNLVKTLYEKYMKYNTKLAESLIGYKLNKKDDNNNIHNKLKKITIATDTIEESKSKNEDLIFHNRIKNIEDSIISSFYIGDTNIDNLRHGYGILLFSDGTKFEGSWIKDNFTGFGRFINTNGDLFEGTFLNGKMNGKGFMRNIEGSIYIGEFVNGERTGFGSEEDKEIYYKGQYMNDLRNGKGKLIFKNSNEEYEGEFKNGLLNGYGIYTFKSGDVYQGEFENGKMHGKGLYKWKSGEEYYGDYKNGIKEGNGSFKYLNGKTYEGQFQKGKPWGKGKILIGDKNKKYNVIFNNGKMIESHKIKE